VTTTSSFETTEFRRSFTQETGELLRKRLIWFISVWGGINLVILALSITMMVTNSNFADLFKDNWFKAFFILTSFAWFGAYLASLLLVIGRKVSSKTIVHLSLGLVILDGALGIGVRVMDIPGGFELWSFVVAHFIACCLFPWTVKQALIPVLVISGASAFSHLVIENSSFVPTLLLTFALILATSPAVFICGVKYSQRIQRSTNKFLNQRYGMLRQELAYARQVHEALFPAPHAIGNIRYSYQYEPMRQIGGDYLYTKIHDLDADGNERLSVVIIDVTGHGIPAALTVNRLHGEIDICFAENPNITPGELLAKLNKYVYLTLAKHSIYATAVCLRVDHAREKIEYASGGHPPAFIRGVDGTLRDVDPTTFVLGACSDNDFDSGQVEVEFMPGDSLIVYTDGAIEARSIDGKMLHIDGLRRILSSPVMPSVDNGGQGQWADRILNEVTAYRGGLPPEDDTLAIEIYRPIGPTVAPIDISASEETLTDPESETVRAAEPV